MTGPERWRRFSFADLICVIACVGVGFGVSAAEGLRESGLVLIFFASGLTWAAVFLGPSLALLHYLRGRRVRPTPCEVLALFQCSLGLGVLTSLAMEQILVVEFFLFGLLMTLVFGPLYLVHEGECSVRLVPTPWTARLGVFLIIWLEILPWLVLVMRVSMAI